MHVSLRSPAFQILKKMIYSEILLLHQMIQMVICLMRVFVTFVFYCSLLIWPGWRKWLKPWFESTQISLSCWHPDYKKNSCFLLHPRTNTTPYGNREQGFLQFFTSSDSGVYCHDIKYLLEAMGLTRNKVEEWMLFIDSSKGSLKCLLLHNGSKYGSVPNWAFSEA